MPFENLHQITLSGMPGTLDKAAEFVFKCDPQCEESMFKSYHFRFWPRFGGVCIPSTVVGTRPRLQREGGPFVTYSKRKKT